jgi:hypothetical protein
MSNVNASGAGGVTLNFIGDHNAVNITEAFDTVQNTDSTIQSSNGSVVSPVPPVRSTDTGTADAVSVSDVAAHTANSAGRPLGQFTENLKPMWRETFCNAMKSDSASAPVVDQIAAVLRDSNIKKEDWDEKFIIEVWLSSEFTQLVKSVKKFRDLVFTDNVLNFSDKKNAKQMNNYRDLFQKSVLFLGELREVYEKETDIAEAIKPVITIVECRLLAKKIGRFQRNVCRRVYDLLFNTESLPQAPVSVEAVQVPHEEEPLEEE